jgi:hypothetical protein
MQRLIRTLKSLFMRSEVKAALALTAFYAAIMGGRMYSIDGFVVYRQAQSIAYERSVFFEAFDFGGGHFTTSVYSLGPSLIQVPTLLLFSGLHTANDLKTDFYRQPLYAIAVDPIFIVITALSALLVWMFIRALGLSERLALWGFLFYGIGSPAMVYSRGDFAQPLEGLCWIAALYGAVRFLQQPRKAWLVLASFAIFYGLITRPVEGALLVAAVFIIVAFRLKEAIGSRETWYFLFSVAAACVLSGVVTLAWNWLRFGSVWDMGMPGGWSTPLRTGLAGSLISPGRGIVWSFPAFILVPFGAYKLWMSRQRVLAVVLVGLVLAQLFNVAKWRMWWGGGNWGLRIFFTALPVIGVLAGVGLSMVPRRYRRPVCWILLGGGVVWATPCIVTDLFTSGPSGDSNGSFLWSAYPPIGAWRGLHHLFATDIGDPYAVDIVWFRYAHLTHYLSLLVPLFLLIVAAVLFRRVLVLSRIAARPTE